MSTKGLPHTDWCALDVDHEGACKPAANSRTAAATAANVARRLARNAAELRENGWIVVSPEDVAKLERTEYGTILMEADDPTPAAPAAPRRSPSELAAELDAIEAKLASLKAGPPKDVDVPELTRMIGLPADQQETVASWANAPADGPWTRAEADGLVLAWHRDTNGQAQ